VLKRPVPPWPVSGPCVQFVPIAAASGPKANHVRSGHHRRQRSRRGERSRAARSSAATAVLRCKTRTVRRRSVANPHWHCDDRVSFNKQSSSSGVLFARSSEHTRPQSAVWATVALFTRTSVNQDNDKRNPSRSFAAAQDLLVQQPSGGQAAVSPDSDACEVCPLAVPLFRRHSEFRVHRRAHELKPPFVTPSFALARSPRFSAWLAPQHFAPSEVRDSSSTSPLDRLLSQQPRRSLGATRSSSSLAFRAPAAGPSQALVHSAILNIAVIKHYGLTCACSCRTRSRLRATRPRHSKEQAHGSKVFGNSRLHLGRAVVAILLHHSQRLLRRTKP